MKRLPFTATTDGRPARVFVTADKRGVLLEIVHTGTHVAASAVLERAVALSFAEAVLAAAKGGA